MGHPQSCSHRAKNKGVGHPSSPGMMLALAIVPGAAEEVIPAEAAAAADSGSLLNLNKSLASQEQMGELAAGEGTPIAGPGTGTVYEMLIDSQLSTAASQVTGKRWLPRTTTPEEQKKAVLKLTLTRTLRPGR